MDENIIPETPDSDQSIPRLLVALKETDSHAWKKRGLLDSP